MFRKENTFDVEGRSGRRQPFVVPSPLLFRASSGRHELSDMLPPEDNTQVGELARF